MKKRKFVFGKVTPPTKCQRCGKSDVYLYGIVTGKKRTYECNDCEKRLRSKPTPKPKPVKKTLTKKKRLVKK